MRVPSDVGRSQDALTAVEEPVGLNRQLAAAQAHFRSGALAVSLKIYGAHLTELGEHKSALAADHEAVDLYRSLRTANEDFYRRGLANALRNLVIDLRK